jgi:hypothetical protein
VDFAEIICPHKQAGHGLVIGQFGADRPISELIALRCVWCFVVFHRKIIERLIFVFSVNNSAIKIVSFRLAWTGVFDGILIVICFATGTMEM